MDEAGTEALREAIQNLHDCGSTFIESIPVHEMFMGKTVWEGSVELFSLIDHPKAKHCYAWSRRTEETARRFYAVLHLGGVTDALMAVRASIVADVQRGLR